MEPYKLTIEDIDKLQAQGLDMTGVPEGAMAEPFELEALGKQLPPMTAEQAGLTPTQATYDASIQAGATPATAPQSGGIPVTAPTPSPAMGAGTAGANPLMGLLAQSDPIPQDPFENLSRSQRTMIGFAALKDAGMALQGKEGGAVSDVMKDITLRADMERKRQAAVARQQMLGSLMGGDLSREAIMAMGVQGLIDGPTLNALLGERDRKDQDAGSTRNKGASAANQLQTLQEITDLIGADPNMTTGPIAMFLRNVPISKAGRTQALIDSLRSTLALDTLKDLKATGATMGALNKEELNILLDDVTKLDLALGADAVTKSLAKIENRYKSVVRQLYAGAAEEDLPMLDEMFSGRPSWLDASAGAPAPTPSVSGKTWNPETQEFEG